jgi:hypothetical protein
MNTNTEITKADYTDRIRHKPEQRLFAQILFADDPAREARILRDIPTRRLSVFGRRCRALLIELHKEGRLDALHVQTVFVGRNHPPLFARWFFATMAAASSTVQWPFEVEEIIKCQQ